MTWVGVIGLFSPQALIRHSRKARDAKTASMILSDLMGRALDTLDAGGATVLQPHVSSEDSGTSRPVHPNIAVIEFNDEDQGISLLEAAAGAMRSRWNEMSTRVISYLRNSGAPVGDAHRWDTHQATFPELAWVLAEGSSSEAAEAAAWEVWDARRLVRDGYRLEPGEPGRSGCTLCGRRDGLLPPGTTFAEQRTSDLRRWETLCGPCLVVRFAVPAKAFGRPVSVPSLTAVAAGPWLAGLPVDVTVVDGLEDLETSARELAWDNADDHPVPGLENGRGVVPYLDALYGVGDPGQPDNEWLAILAEARQRLVRGYQRLPTRYVLVAFDGDQMGEHFRTRTGAERSALSANLAEFAQQVAPSVVESRAVDGRCALGSLLYAGGDDGRFLVPAATALDAVERLRLAFGELLGGPTLSAGIAFAEVHHPLDAVVDAANDALETAKEEYGRASFCASWLTGRGSRTAGGGFAATGQPLIPAVLAVAGAFSRNEISKGLTHAIDTLAAADWPAGGPCREFEDLVHERLVAGDTSPEAVVLVRSWMHRFEPGRAAGLARLARDLASVGVGV